MKKILFALGALAFASSAFAYEEISTGTITELGSGWYYDSMWVRTTGVPEGGTPSCSWDNTTYKTDPNSAERKAHHATLLLAYAMGKAVKLALDGCYEGYPKIVGVRIPVQ